MKKITLKKNGADLAYIDYSPEMLLRLHSNFRLEKIRGERYNIKGVRKN